MVAVISASPSATGRDDALFDGGDLQRLLDDQLHALGHLLPQLSAARPLDDEQRCVLSACSRRTSAGSTTSDGSAFTSAAAAGGSSTSEARPTIDKTSNSGARLHRTLSPVWR